MSKKPTVLTDFKKVRLDKIKDLQVGDLIKYSVNRELRHGGKLHKNMFPKYIVLANYQKKVTWSVQLTEPSLILYVKTKKQMDAEKAEMKRLYKEMKDQEC
jgi:hypothetical protein